MKRCLCSFFLGLALAAAAGAGTWLETSQSDFADGIYNANVYSSDDGTTGSVRANPGQLFDLNKDGHPDLVMSNFQNSGNFNCYSYIYWGSDSGYNTGNHSDLLTHGATANAIADLDRDGNLDIVFCCYHNGSSTDINSLIYWGSKTGFHAGDTTGLPTMGAHSVFIVDLNHDGHLDIVFANLQSYPNVEIPSYIYWGGPGDHGGYSTARRTELPTKASEGVSVADLNQDGRLDLVFSCARRNLGEQPDAFETYSYIYYGQGTDSIYYDTAHRDSLHTHGAYGNAIADLDHDGWLDLVFCNNRTEPSYNIHSFIYYGSAIGFSANNMDSLPTHGTAACGIADLNQDGHEDIVFANGEIGFEVACDTSYIYWGSNTGFAAGNRSDLPIYSGASVLIGKLNPDGYLDLMIERGLDPGYSYIFYGSAEGYTVNNLDSIYTTRGHVSTKDIGNVQNRSLTEDYCSSVFGDGSVTYCWGACSWESSLPVGSGLLVALRVGNTADPDDGSWSSWTTVAFAGARAGLPDAKYAQYRILATANDLFEGPAVDQVALDYTTTGVPGQPGDGDALFFESRSTGSGALFIYQLPRPAAVRIDIFNVAGQLVARVADGLMTAGRHQHRWLGEASGTYLCRAVIDGSCFIRKLVIVR